MQRATKAFFKHDVLLGSREATRVATVGLHGVVSIDVELTTHLIVSFDDSAQVIIPIGNVKLVHPATDVVAPQKPTSAVPQLKAKATTKTK